MLQKYYKKPDFRDIPDYSEIYRPDYQWLVVFPVSDKSEVLEKANRALPGQVIYCPLSRQSNYWILEKNTLGNLVRGVQPIDGREERGYVALTSCHQGRSMTILRETQVMSDTTTGDKH